MICKVSKISLVVYRFVSIMLLIQDSRDWQTGLQTTCTLSLAFDVGQDVFVFFKTCLNTFDWESILLGWILNTKCGNVIYSTCSKV